MKPPPSAQELRKICESLTDWFDSQGIEIPVVLLVLAQTFADVLVHLEDMTGQDDAHFERMLRGGLEIIDVRARNNWATTKQAEAGKPETKQ